MTSATVGFPHGKRNGFDAGTPIGYVDPMGKRPALNGETLSQAALSRLCLTLPGPLPPWLVGELRKRRLLGGGVRIAAANGTLHTLALFTAERIVEEALDYDPGRSLYAEGWLPVADSGRGSRTVYLVALGGRPRGALYAWEPATSGDAGVLAPLGATLADISKRGEPVRATPRRRLPPKRHVARPPRRTRTSAAAKPASLFEPRQS